MGQPIMNDKIDEGILPLVKLLITNGYKTTASCQGGEGHSSDLTWVYLSWEDPVFTEEDANQLATLLMENGIYGFTLGHERVFQAGETPLYSYIHIQLFNSLVNDD